MPEARLLTLALAFKRLAEDGQYSTPAPAIATAMEDALDNLGVPFHLEVFGAGYWFRLIETRREA